MKSQQFTHFILVNNYVIFKIKYLNILENLLNSQIQFAKEQLFCNCISCGEAFLFKFE